MNFGKKKVYLVLFNMICQFLPKRDGMLFLPSSWKVANFQPDLLRYENSLHMFQWSWTYIFDPEASNTKNSCFCFTKILKQYLRNVFWIICEEINFEKKNDKMNIQSIMIMIFYLSVQDQVTMMVKDNPYVQMV